MWWGNQYVAGTAGYAIAAQYGELRFCFLAGNTWVLTTLGKDGASAAMLLYECASEDAACLDNKNDHPFERWTLVYSGAIGPLRVVDEQTIIFGGQKLDLATGTVTEDVAGE